MKKLLPLLSLAPIAITSCSGASTPSGGSGTEPTPQEILTYNLDNLPTELQNPDKRLFIDKWNNYFIAKEDAIFSHDWDNFDIDNFAGVDKFSGNELKIISDGSTYYVLANRLFDYLNNQNNSFDKGSIIGSNTVYQLENTESSENKYTTNIADAHYNAGQLGIANPNDDGITFINQYKNNGIKIDGTTYTYTPGALTVEWASATETVWDRYIKNRADGGYATFRKGANDSFLMTSTLEIQEFTLLTKFNEPGTNDEKIINLSSAVNLGEWSAKLPTLIGGYDSTKVGDVVSDPTNFLWQSEPVINGWTDATTLDPNLTNWKLKGSSISIHAQDPNDNTKTKSDFSGDYSYAVFDDTLNNFRHKSGAPQKFGINLFKTIDDVNAWLTAKDTTWNQDYSNVVKAAKDDALNDVMPIPTGITEITKANFYMWDHNGIYKSGDRPADPTQSTQAVGEFRNLPGGVTFDKDSTTQDLINLGLWSESGMAMTSRNEFYTNKSRFIATFTDWDFNINNATNRPDSFAINGVNYSRTETSKTYQWTKQDKITTLTSAEKIALISDIKSKSMYLVDNGHVEDSIDNMVFDSASINSLVNINKPSSPGTTTIIINGTEYDITWTMQRP